ncbi:site-2 protease family protein [Aquimarina sp. M1]
MKKKSKSSRYILYGAIFFISLIISLLVKKNNLVSNIILDTPPEKYMLVIGTILVSFIVLGVHELGHLIIGLVQGFKFQLFVVGPLGIRQENDKTTLYFNKNLAYYGGVAATTPKDNHPDNAKKFANVLLAGPIASILFSIVLFCIGYYAGNPLQSIFYTGGAASVGIFFATTIPSKTGAFFTDRKRYQRLTQSGKDQEVELAILRILGNYAKDNSYKNVSENDIGILVSDDIPFIHFFGLSTLICFQLENKGSVEERVLESYTNYSENMPKSIVKAFDKEIERFTSRQLL